MRHRFSQPRPKANSPPPPWIRNWSLPTLTVCTSYAGIVHVVCFHGTAARRILPCSPLQSQHGYQSIYQPTLPYGRCCRTTVSVGECTLTPNRKNRIRRIDSNIYLTWIALNPNYCWLIGITEIYKFNISSTNKVIDWLINWLIEERQLTGLFASRLIGKR